MRKNHSRIEFLHLPAGYYKFRTGREPDREHTELMARMLDSGLAPKDIMEATDAALKKGGDKRPEAEIWEDIRERCLKKWKEYKRAGIWD